MFDRYMQPKRAFSGGFSSTFELSTAAVTQTLVEVKRTTPLYEPKEHIIRVQRVTVIVTTGAAQTWQLRSATTHTIITPSMSMLTAGTKFEYDFGPQGIEVDQNEDLQVLISAAGAAGIVLVEGFWQITVDDLDLGFTLSPTSGDVHFDKDVTLTAAEGTTFFEGDVSVTVDGIDATDALWVSETSITCTFPLVGTGNTGAVDVVVTLADGTILTQAASFTWTESAYAITVVAPNSGTTAGGDAVTLTGYFFGASVAITFDGIPATAIVPNANGLTCTCVTPAHAAGAVDVVLLNTDTTTATAAGGFTYA
jgi:hypothetical protein